MCGRFAQFRTMEECLAELRSEQDVIGWYEHQPDPRYNIAPGTIVPVLHPGDNALRIDGVHWGWAPFWAKGKRPDPINARIETVLAGRFFKALWPHGRALVMADGWYEWVKDSVDPKKKQPYFIRLKSQSPMFFAALAQVRPGLEPGDGDGFVIITADSDSGMVDIHDRRPIVLTPENARRWLEQDLEPHEAEAIARDGCVPVDDFEWHPVGRAVGNVRNQGSELIRPITD